MPFIIAVSPDEMVPPAALRLWPDMIANHGVTIVAGLREDGSEQLHMIFSTNTPPWALMGMLQAVLSDVTAMWQSGLYVMGEIGED